MSLLRHCGGRAGKDQWAPPPLSSNDFVAADQLENERAERIRRNQEMLASLGLKNSPNYGLKRRRKSMSRKLGNELSKKSDNISHPPVPMKSKRLRGQPPEFSLREVNAYLEQEDSIHLQDFNSNDDADKSKPARRMRNNGNRVMKNMSKDNRGNRTNMNPELAEVFNELANAMFAKKELFKGAAYRKVSGILSKLGYKVTSGEEARKRINGVGASSAKYIEEYLQNGTVTRLEKFRKELGSDVLKRRASTSVDRKNHSDHIEFTLEETNADDFFQSFGLQAQNESLRLQLPLVKGVSTENVSDASPS